jgi:acetoin utilization protein AcuB
MRDQLVQTPITDCMTPDPLTVTPDVTLASVYDLMLTHSIRRMPVICHSGLVGIVTLSDVLHATPADVERTRDLAMTMRALSKIAVGEVMTADPLVIAQGDTVGHAAELMLENKLGGLPVVDEAGALTGLITESDIFRLIAHRWHDDNLMTAMGAQ